MVIAPPVPRCPASPSRPAVRPGWFHGPVHSCQPERLARRWRPRRCADGSLGAASPREAPRASATFRLAFGTCVVAPGGPLGGLLRGVGLRHRRHELLDLLSTLGAASWSRRRLLGNPPRWLHGSLMRRRRSDGDPDTAAGWDFAPVRARLNVIRRTGSDGIDDPAPGSARERARRPLVTRTASSRRTFDEPCGCKASCPNRARRCSSIHQNGGLPTAAFRPPRRLVRLDRLSEVPPSGGASRDPLSPAPRQRGTRTSRPA